MIIDIVIGVVVIVSALISFLRGFIREVLTVAGVVCGLLAAWMLGPSFLPTVNGWLGVVEDEKVEKLLGMIPMDIVAYAVAYGLIFIAVVIIISILSHFIAGAAKAVGLGPVDRTLGVIFGIARAVLLLGLLYIPFKPFLSDDAKADMFAESHSFIFVEHTADALAGFFPSSEDVKKTADDKIKQKLLEQDLLGGSEKKDSGNKDDQKTEQKNDSGYNDENREKLDNLFKDAPEQPKPKYNE